MKKVKMQPFSSMTFEEGCEKHFLYCRQRNLSETTLIRYRACYSLYYKFFDRDMPLSKIDAEMYNAYILYLRDRLDNAITIKSYLRTLIAVLHYLMREGDLPSFELHTTKIKMQQGCYNSQKLEEIDSIWIEGCKDPGFYKKAAVHNHLVKYPGTIQVDIYPYPNLVPATSARGEKYVRSTPNGYQHDNLLDLPRA